jgi:hypothetical protein
VLFLGHAAYAQALIKLSSFECLPGYIGIWALAS